MDDELGTFSGKQKVREFVNSIPATKKIQIGIQIGKRGKAQRCREKIRATKNKLGT